LSNYSYSIYATYTADGTIPDECAVPSGLSASSIGETSATLSWNSVSGAESYDVRYKATSASSWTTTNRTSTSYSVSGLSASTEYEFQVRTNCSDGSSDYSASSTFTTDDPVPTTCDVPTNLAASNITGSSAKLSWTAVSGAESYDVRYKMVYNSNWTSVNTVSASYNLSGLSPFAQYEFQVRTNCSSGSSDYSDSENFMTRFSFWKASAEDEDAGIPTEFALNQNYPNPFNPRTYIKFAIPEQGFITLKIFNMAGKEIRTLANQIVSAGRYTIEWDGKDNQMNQVSSGIYIYQMNYDGKLVSKKMMLVK
jgi:hypothetical protein